MGKGKGRRALPLVPPAAPRPALAVPEQPRVRRFKISPEQAELYRTTEAQVLAAQERMQAIVTAMLAGHGIVAAQQVQLEVETDGTYMSCLDTSAVTKHARATAAALRAGAPAAAPTPPAASPPAEPPTQP